MNGSDSSSPTVRETVHLAELEIQLQKIKEKEERNVSARHIWLSHHWPSDYQKRCAKIGKYHVCRRCSALYPLAVFVAFAAALGYPLWPNSLDPLLIWLLCLPATVAYIGEAIGVFRYNPKWQVGAMLLTATAFGKALHYELLERWSPEFWEPLVAYGALWGVATVFSAITR